MFCINSEAKTYINIATLLNQNAIEARVLSHGGHTAECISVWLANKLSDSLFIRVEPGRRLISINIETQDILIVKEELICLGPKETKTLTLNGYCCQSSLKSPHKEEEFSIGIMEDKPLVELAEFINFGEYSKGAIQSAIWVISNNHKIASVCAGDNENDKKLRRRVAEITERLDPWYCIKYEEQDSVVFSDKHTLITGDFSYYIKHYCTIDIVIRNNKSGLLTILANDIPYQMGHYTYNLEQLIIGWPKGKYELLVIEDNSNYILKKEIEL
jgi:hypothetical protein